jgi:hypothetical protein
MCLSVYIGSNHRLEFPPARGTNGLTAEPAKWKPAPLLKFEYCYYIGQDSGGAELGCSCQLVERIEWTEQGPVPWSDPLYPNDGPCPFDTLRGYVEQAIHKNSHAVLVCDDSAGDEQVGVAEDFEQRFIRPSMIKRGNLLFASQYDFPWCVFYVMADGEIGRPPDDAPESV